MRRKIVWEDMGEFWPKTDYGRLLRTWGFLGRSGLSIHALATLLRRSPRVLLRQMLADGTVHASHCYDINAPIWINGAVWEGGRHYHTTAVEETRQLMRRYPWPKYRNLHDMRGLTRFRGISKFELRVLRQAVKGRKPKGDVGAYYDDDAFMNERPF